MKTQTRAASPTAMMNAETAKAAAGLRPNVSIKTCTMRGRVRGGLDESMGGRMRHAGVPYGKGWRSELEVGELEVGEFGIRSW